MRLLKPPSPPILDQPFCPSSIQTWTRLTIESGRTVQTLARRDVDRGPPGNKVAPSPLSFFLQSTVVRPWPWFADVAKAFRKARPFEDTCIE